jgi:hypothetical protein
MCNLGNTNLFLSRYNLQRAGNSARAETELDADN